MKYVKNLVKILFLAQCLLLFCTCDKKEVVTTEQNILNLADFVKCPFNEEFDSNTNLEKYVLKKFGKPKYIRKWRAPLYDYSKVVADQIYIQYVGYSFDIYRGVFKKFEVFKNIYIRRDYTDFKYRINNETTIQDVERLFGKPESVDDRDSYFYIYSPEGPYQYHLRIAFIDGKIYSISIDIKM